MDVKTICERGTGGTKNIRIVEGIVKKSE